MKTRGAFLSPSFLSFWKSNRTARYLAITYGGYMEIYTVAWLAAGLGILAYFVYSKFIKK